MITDLADILTNLIGHHVRVLRKPAAVEARSFCEQKEPKKLFESDAWDKAPWLPHTMPQIQKKFLGAFFKKRCLKVSQFTQDIPAGIG